MMQSPQSIREFAPAKVNLTLEVLGKRRDGYHELQSLVAFASDVGDVLSLAPGEDFRCSVGGPMAARIEGPNIIERAADILRQAAPGVGRGAVHLEKHLPVAAGIGGGSSDAAAFLRAVARANPDQAGEVDWWSIAREIGADVPVCLNSRLTWMGGIGEILKPVPNDGSLWSVLINPGVALATAEVFRALGAPPLMTDTSTTFPDLSDSPSGLIAYLRTSRNDLEAPAIACVPVIADVLEALRALPRCALARLSGSGATCFGLFGTQGEARDAGEAISQRHPGWWVACARLGDAHSALPFS